MLEVMGETKEDVFFAFCLYAYKRFGHITHKIYHDSNEIVCIINNAYAYRVIQDPFDVCDHDDDDDQCDDVRWN
jgi:hypothetical protein